MKSSSAHDFEIPVFCKQFGIHDNETPYTPCPGKKESVVYYA